MTTAEIAWAAGFFDGEGCIRTRRLRGVLCLHVSVTQNVREPLATLREWFGGHVEHEVVARQERYRWVVTHARARAFLQAVLPYLRVKHARAAFALTSTPAELAAVPNRRVSA